jgi:hypothetical protein
MLGNTFDKSFFVVSKNERLNCSSAVKMNCESDGKKRRTQHFAVVSCRPVRRIALRQVVGKNYLRSFVAKKSKWRVFSRFNHWLSALTERYGSVTARWSYAQQTRQPTVSCCLTSHRGRIAALHSVRLVSRHRLLATASVWRNLGRLRRAI